MKVLVNNSGLTYKDVFKKTDYELWVEKEKRNKEIMEWASSIGSAIVFVIGSLLLLFTISAMQ